MRPGLPYVDNAKAVLITLVINLGAVRLFNWPGGVTYSGVIWDSLFCAAVTTAINILIVHTRLKSLRSKGEMPGQVPESPFMQRLPQNPVLLGIVCAIAFAALAAGLNAAILWFFGLRGLAFAPWLVYKLIYATVLSVKIVEFCIFRYVQPDWAGAAPSGSAETEKLPGRPVRNPWPKVDVFKEMFGGVAGNIALNMIVGYVLGGIKIGADGSVVIPPTTVEGMAVTGFVFGLIVGALVTNGVVTAMNAAILASSPAGPETAAADKRLAWMPKGRLALIGLICLGLTVFSAAALPSILVLFGLPRLNFYQFVVFITVYAAIIGKPLSFILTRRCLQPDYACYILKKVRGLKNTL